MNILSMLGLMKVEDHEAAKLRIANGYAARVAEIEVDRDQWRTDCLEAISDGEVIEKRLTTVLTKQADEIADLEKMQDALLAMVKALRPDAESHRRKRARDAAVKREKRAARKGVGK